MSRVKCHVCNPLCDGDEHSDVVWSGQKTAATKRLIEETWNAEPEAPLFVLLDVRLVEGGRPSPEQVAARVTHGRDYDQWPACYAWGVRWKELPIDEEAG